MIYEINNVKILLDSELRNPFIRSLQSERQVKTEEFRDLIQNGNMSHIFELVQMGKGKEFHLKLILAYGYFNLRQANIPPSKLFEKAPFFNYIASDFKDKEDLIYSLVYAAGNCFNQLQKIAGDSEEIWKVKEHVWSACFGKSIYHAFFLKKLIRKQTTILLGETGTGKELFANSILDADYSGKPKSPTAVKKDCNPEFRDNKVIRNIAALPDTLIESELFGHTADAFTGAKKDKKGAFELADKGIIFLDEIGDMPIEQQAKVLRVVENGDYYKLGAVRPTKVDVRTVAATNQDVYDKEKFRPELLERLSGNIIEIPPLRDRKGDIKVIGNMLYKKWVKGELVEQKWDYLIKGFSDYLKKLNGLIYNWSGNVRELETYIKRYLIGVDQIPKKRVGIPVKPDDITLPDGLNNFTWSWIELRKWYAQKVLEKYNGTKSKTLLSLGISRNTLADWIK